MTMGRGIEKKLKKKRNLETFEEEVALLEDEGHKTIRFTDYHCRIDEIDVWPSSRKFMRRGKVLHYNQLKDIFSDEIKEEFNNSIY